MNILFLFQKVASLVLRQGKCLVHCQFLVFGTPPDYLHFVQLLLLLSNNAVFYQQFLDIGVTFSNVCSGLASFQFLLIYRAHLRVAFWNMTTELAWFLESSFTKLATVLFLKSFSVYNLGLFLLNDLFSLFFIGVKMFCFLQYIFRKFGTSIQCSDILSKWNQNLEIYPLIFLFSFKISFWCSSCVRLLMKVWWVSTLFFQIL